VLEDQQAAEIAEINWTIRVERFARQIDESKITTILVRFGPLESVRVIQDGPNFAARAVFEHQRSAQKAVFELNGRRYDGATLNVHFEFPEEMIDLLDGLQTGGSVHQSRGVEEQQEQEDGMTVMRGVDENRGEQQEDTRPEPEEGGSGGPAAVDAQTAEGEVANIEEQAINGPGGDAQKGTANRGDGEQEVTSGEQPGDAKEETADEPDPRKEEERTDREEAMVYQETAVNEEGQSVEKAEQIEQQGPTGTNQSVNGAEPVLEQNLFDDPEAEHEQIMQEEIGYQEQACGQDPADEAERDAVDGLTPGE
jgi:hypothetical protein